MFGCESAAEKILVVEDDIALLKLIQRHLQQAGFQTGGAASGMAALRWLEAEPAALMLLDYSLPDMQGEELLDELDRLDMHVPFVVATGNGSEMVAVEMMKRGARDYLIKGSSFLKLLPTVVQQTLGRLEQERRLVRTEAELHDAHQRLQQQLDRRAAELAEADAQLTRLRQGIADHRRAEPQPRQLAAQWIAAIGRGVLGEIAQWISDDLGQRLAAIADDVQAGQLLVQDPPAHDPRELQASLGRVVEQLGRAGDVIEHLRRLVATTRPVPAPVDIGGLVRDVAAMLEPDCRAAGVEVRLELCESLPPASADRAQIEQVVIQLVYNALDAMRATEVSQRRLAIRTSAVGTEGICVAIEDQGVGISPENLPRIFDRFFTTKPGALGLGLPISRSIVEGHGGTLSCVAHAEHGMTFEVILPVYRGGEACGK